MVFGIGAKDAVVGTAAGALVDVAGVVVAAGASVVAPNKLLELVEKLKEEARGAAPKKLGVVVAVDVGADVVVAAPKAKGFAPKSDAVVVVAAAADVVAVVVVVVVVVSLVAVVVEVVLGAAELVVVVAPSL